MSVKERLIEFINFKKMSIRSFEKLCGLSFSYVNNMRVSIQPDKINNIAQQFPDLNTGWLLTGEGKMLKETEISPVNNPEISDDESITISKDFYEILLAQKDVVKFQQQSIKDLQEALKSSREQITLFQETVSLQQKSIEHLSTILSKENVVAKSTTTEPAKCAIAG